MNLAARQVGRQVVEFDQGRVCSSRQLIAQAFDSELTDSQSAKKLTAAVKINTEAPLLVKRE